MVVNDEYLGFGLLVGQKEKRSNLKTALWVLGNSIYFHNALTFKCHINELNLKINQQID